MYDLSVIIPTRNRMRLLKKVLWLMQQQTYPQKSFEVIVIDDCSSDGTEDAVKQYMDKVDYNLVYIRQKKKGPAAARNKGIRQAQSDFIFFIGDDILPDKELVAQHIYSLRKHPDTAILGFTDWNKESLATDFMNYISPNGFQFRYNTIKNAFDCGFQHFYTSNISIAKKWFSKDLFDESFPFGALEDTELAYRLEKKGLKIIFNKDALGYHAHDMTVESFCKKIECAGESTPIFLKKHPELKRLFLPVHPAVGNILIKILRLIPFMKRINKKFYWYCLIADAFLRGFEKGNKK